MSKDIKGKLAVVTGADGGIGMEFCRELARRGADIAMLSITGEPLQRAAETIAREYGVKTYPLTVDLCAPDTTDTVLSFLDERGLTPYILVNNAGIFSFDYLTEIPERKVNAFVDLHVRAVTLFSRSFADRMAQAGGGYILNMSSMSCWMPMPGLSLYASTKAYIRALSRSLHYEMRDRGVSVMVACPGGISTDLFGLPDNLKKLAVNIGVLSTPQKFTRKAVARMLRGKAQYINGMLNRFSILFIGSMPRPVRMLVKTQLLDKGIRKP